jgi:NitT/TauT family transport system substrate-binding protein
VGSDGSDGIIGRNIKSPADVKGKTIGRENVLFEQVLLRAYLQKGGLAEKDVTIKDIPAPDAASAFAAKRVDVAVTFEPFMIDPLPRLKARGIQDSGRDCKLSLSDIP